MMSNKAWNNFIKNLPEESFFQTMLLAEFLDNPNVENQRIGWKARFSRHQISDLMGMTAARIAAEKKAGIFTR